MKNIRRFIQQYLFYHTTIDVVDSNTGENQKATYSVFFGFILRIKYSN